MDNFVHKYFQRSIVDEWLWITFLFLHTRNRFPFFPVIILLFFIHICACCTKKIHFSSYLSAFHNVLYLFFDISKAISWANNLIPASFFQSLSPTSNYRYFPLFLSISGHFILHLSFIPFFFIHVIHFIHTAPKFIDI